MGHYGCGTCVGVWPTSLKEFFGSGSPGKSVGRLQGAPSNLQTNFAFLGREEALLTEEPPAASTMTEASV